MLSGAGRGLHAREADSSPHVQSLGGREGEWVCEVCEIVGSSETVCVGGGGRGDEWVDTLDSLEGDAPSSSSPG